MSKTAYSCLTSALFHGVGSFVTLLTLKEGELIVFHIIVLNLNVLAQ
jgi:hypothetical protein